LRNVIRKLLFAAVCLACAGPLFAESVPVLSLSLDAGAILPALDTSADYLGLSAGTGFVADVTLPAALPGFLAWRFELGGQYFPLKTVQYFSYPPWSASFATGLVARFPLVPWFDLSLSAVGGYYQAFTSAGGNMVTGGGFCLDTAAGAEFNLGSSFTIGVNGHYALDLGLTQGFFVSLAAGTHIPLAASSSAVAAKPAEKPQTKPEQPVAQTTKPQALKEGPQAQISMEWLDARALMFDNLFPVFYKHYADSPIGSVLVKNTLAKPMKNVTVSLWINKFMDTPMQIAGPASLAAGEERKIDLTALFNDRVLEITEATRVAVELTFQYALEGTTYQQKKTDVVTIYDRNAITWDDDKKVAAFVSEKDPAVLTFSKNVAAVVKSRGNAAINLNLQTALAMHQALQLFGLSYVPDPKSPYAESSKRKDVVDFLQFPRQTFEYKSGDCDDLTILFCSLLEAVGIETAAITIPGHIFMAFAIDTPPAEVRKSYLHPDDFIFMEDKSWVPVEITERTAGFLSAWQSGAQEWRENVSRQQANFYPIHEAWQTYEPVGLTGIGQGVTVPAAGEIAASYQSEIEKFVDMETTVRVARIQSDIKKGETPKLDNSLGVLYARYGLNDRAQAAFAKAVVKEEYLPALLNLANIAFSQRHLDQAASYADRALKQAPDNPQALLAVARVNHAMENYGQVARAYTKLKELSPDLAAAYAYLDLRGADAQKAADISNASGASQWVE